MANGVSPSMWYQVTHGESYLLAWGRSLWGMIQEDPTPIGWAAVAAVVGALGGSLNVAMVALFGLWCADMALGNLIPIVQDLQSWLYGEEKRRWDPVKNLDGILRLLVYGIVGASAVFVQEYLKAGGMDTGGAILWGAFGVAAIGEFRSILTHWVRIHPDARTFAQRILATFGTDLDTRKPPPEGPRMPPGEP